ncbi:MAG: sulfurtransferase [bacterium]|nr:sulfurtransferase [bacterium]
MLIKPKTVTMAGLLAVALVSSPCALAAGADPGLPPVVSTSWLAEHLDDPDLVVLHIGAPDSYEKSHIPGAIKASLRQLIRVNDAGIRDEMLSAEGQADELGALGIDDRSQVVVYFSDSNAAWAAARFLITLEYVGLNGRATYLDGGLPEWVSQGNPVSTEAAVVEPTEPTITINDDILVATDWLSARIDGPGIALVDGRPAEGYSGAEGHWERLGHIPGAANIPFFTMLAEDPPYLLKTRNELQTIFREAGAEPGDTVVVYCGTGLWGSLPFLAARYIGLDVRLYDGSFQEWSANENLPVVASAAHGE